MKKILLIFLVTSIVLSSCSTEDDPLPVTHNEVDEKSADRHHPRPARLKARFLAGHYKKLWQAEKYFINGVDYTSLFQECSLDNVQIFYLDGRYVEIEGKTKCNPNDPFIFDQGTYEFNESYTQFIFHASHLEATFDIVELTPFSFKIKYLDPALGEVELWLKPARIRHHGV